MTRGAGTTLAAYARTIERWWSEFLDAPVVFSPRDWNLITEWHEAGVPLEIVREAIDDAAERARRRRSRSAPRGLGYLAKAVEEGLSAIREGRVPREETAPEPDGPRMESAPDQWRRRALEEASESPLRGFIEGILALLDAGEPVEALDERVDEELGKVVCETTLREVDEEIERRLEPFRRRMEAATLDSTRRKATARLLRERVRLPRLSD